MSHLRSADVTERKNGRNLIARKAADLFVGGCHERQGSNECRSGDSAPVGGRSPQSAERGRGVGCLSREPRTTWNADGITFWPGG